jgi:hypothetical protein
MSTHQFTGLAVGHGKCQPIRLQDWQWDTVNFNPSGYRIGSECVKCKESNCKRNVESCPPTGRCVGRPVSVARLCDAALVAVMMCKLLDCTFTRTDPYCDYNERFHLITHVRLVGTNVSEDGDIRIFRNAGTCVSGYTALHPKKKKRLILMFTDVRVSISYTCLTVINVSSKCAWPYVTWHNIPCRSNFLHVLNYVMLCNLLINMYEAFCLSFCN